jgi:hypothetical protein
VQCSKAPAAVVGVLCAPCQLTDTTNQQQLQPATGSCLVSSSAGSIHGHYLHVCGPSCQSAAARLYTAVQHQWHTPQNTLLLALWLRPHVPRPLCDCSSSTAQPCHTQQQGVPPGRVTPAAHALELVTMHVVCAGVVQSTHPPGQICTSESVRGWLQGQPPPSWQQRLHCLSLHSGTHSRCRCSAWRQESRQGRTTRGPTPESTPGTQLPAGTPGCHLVSPWVTPGDIMWPNLLHHSRGWNPAGQTWPAGNKETV